MLKKGVGVTEHSKHRVYLLKLQYREFTPAKNQVQ